VLWVGLAVLVVLALFVVTLRSRRGPRRTSTAPPSPAGPAAPPRGAPVGHDAPPAVDAPGAPEPSAAPPALRERLGRTRGLFAPLRALGGRADAAAFDAAEEALLRADVGVETTQALLAELRRSQAHRAGADGLLAALGSQ